MRVMNEVLKDFIRKIVIFYLDDILIYWQSKEEHMKHVRTLLEKLQKDKLWINLQKCSFMKTKLFFWGFVIPKDGLKMDPGKFKAIIDCLPQRVQLKKEVSMGWLVSIGNSLGTLVEFVVQ